MKKKFVLPIIDISLLFQVINTIRKPANPVIFEPVRVRKGR